MYVIKEGSGTMKMPRAGRASRTGVQEDVHPDHEDVQVVAQTRPWSRDRTQKTGPNGVGFWDGLIEQWPGVLSMISQRCD